MVKVIAKMENYILGNSSNSLLFVYQSKWQMDLIKRYGNEMILLDATYKTTRYLTFIFHGCQDKCRLSDCSVICH